MLEKVSLLQLGAGPVPGFPPKSTTREPLFGGPPARGTLTF